MHAFGSEGGWFDSKYGLINLRELNEFQVQPFKEIIIKRNITEKSGNVVDGADASGRASNCCVWVSVILIINYVDQLITTLWYLSDTCNEFWLSSWDSRSRSSNPWGWIQVCVYMQCINEQLGEHRSVLFKFRTIQTFNFRWKWLLIVRKMPEVGERNIWRSHWNVCQICVACFYLFFSSKSMIQVDVLRRILFSTP